MKKDTSYTIRRARRFPVILIGEGLLVGIIGGLVVLFYRIALVYSCHQHLSTVNHHPVRSIFWWQP